MITTNHQPIPKDKLYQFQDILKAKGGRFLSNPYEEKDCYRVSYYYDDVGDANSQSKAWNRVTQQITEKRSDQWYRILIRRIYRMIFKHSQFKVHYCI